MNSRKKHLNSEPEKQYQYPPVPPLPSHINKKLTILEWLLFVSRLIAMGMIVLEIYLIGLIDFGQPLLFIAAVIFCCLAMFGLLTIIE